MPATNADDVESTFAELSRACSLQAHNKIITIADKILSQHPSEYKAFQCKVVALIRLEKYEECIGVIKKFPDFLKYVLFEKAYAEYRLNRTNEAAKTLQDCDPNDLRVIELKAQVHYRKEEFHESYACLRNVIRNSQDDFSEERLTNLAAVAASATCFGDEDIDIDIQPDMYEAKFNLACGYLGHNENTKAESLLQQAEDMCRGALLEDPEVTEDDLDEELAPIRTQQAYILQRAQKEEAANKIYQAVTRTRAIDPALLAVASNNIVCINREQNIFDSRKRIKVASIDGLQHKLFARQRHEMLLNQGLFHWHTNQVDACTAKVRAVLQENPRCPRAVLLQATQFIKEKRMDRAVGVLQDYCDQLDQSQTGNLADLAVILALGQLRLHRGSDGRDPGPTQPAQALDVFYFWEKTMPDQYLHSAGVLSTRIALCMIACTGEQPALDRSKAFELINNMVQAAVDWYESTNDQDPVINQLLDHATTFFLQHGQAERAANWCERQLARLSLQSSSSTGPQKQALTAKLVRAYAQFDRPKAEATCRNLKFKEVLTDADVDSMETTFLYGVKAMKRQGRPGEAPSSGDNKHTTKGKRSNQTTPGLVVSTGGTNPEVQVKSVRRKKKKRKIRLPKNYDPTVPPDPDRWLPRRERPQYRKRRDKRHAPLGRGPQGRVAGSADLDASTRSPRVTTAVNSPHAGDAAGSTPKQQSGRPMQRKGRRKGR